MPHAYWSGFLRLSLVSCPIYLSPATSERERISLHQINPKTGNRIKLLPVDSETGDELDRADLIRGYEVEKGRYIEITKDELSTLKIESSRVLELSRFVARDDINPLYLDTPYYVYPENAQAEEAYQVITAAMAETKRVGIGRIVVSQRERPVALEPFEKGMLLSMLRTSEEVRPAEVEEPHHKLDPQMIEIAITIIERLTGKFEPKGFHDQYQDALRQLVESKQKGKPLQRAAFDEPHGNVVDLMAVLKKSLASTGGRVANENAGAEEAAPRSAKKARGKKADARQRNLLLPIDSGKKPAAAKRAAAEHAPARSRRKRA
ncbi:MAG TPA: Ku protein [Stellaceae bacterium]|jgi:DNA end-binding protein Ku|nr:Ku protein [Stellaceae bacterium]